MTEQTQIGQRGDRSTAGRVARLTAVYDMRRLTYAGTFKNPFKAGTIRAIEWLTGKSSFCA